MNENIKIIIFDVDDTLIYTIDTAYKKTSLAGKKVYNMSLKKTDFINLYGKHKFEECIRYWYNAKDISEFINEYNNIKLEYEYIGDIKQIIEDIKKFNIIIGIVTNSTKEKTERKLNKYVDLFDFIYVDAEKPNEKAILNIIKKYSVKKEEVILIGDSENDYQASKNAHINFCGVNTGKKKWDNENVKYIESINDLIKEGKLLFD